MDSVDPNDSLDSSGITMQCARVTGTRKPLDVCEMPVPSTPEEGVLLRTLYAGVCHSDVHFIDGEDEDDGTIRNRQEEVLGDSFRGVVPGHEICGEVVEVGKMISHSCTLTPGDVVIVHPWRGCNECETCSGGANNLCENNPCGTKDIGQSEFGGGYGSMVIVPEAERCIKLPANIPREIGCMLPCSALVAYSAIKDARPYLEHAVRTRGVANLLLIGLGGLGNWAVILMKQIFCDKNIKVICADSNRDKLDTAEEMGADDVVHWEPTERQDSLVTATTVSGYNLMDAAIDFVGSTMTSQIAIQSLHRGGCLVLIGLHCGKINISIEEIVSRSIAIIGQRVAPLTTLRELVDLFAVQELERYPKTEIVSLSEINEVLDRLRKGKVKGRAIIKY